MELSKNYIPADTENKWYSHWTNKEYFRSTPDERTPYTIVIPPPNVTGVLHMGHTLNETVQDILIRHARMHGYNACWVPGSDHASIATEAKVVAMLKEKGIDKKKLSREEFMEYAFEWKEKYGGIIYQQIKKLGCSCDWERVNFTMNDHYYKAVIKTFVELYNKGLIYRGARMINWDPQAKTALSDEEVEYREVNSKLYYISYPIDGSSETITVATTRPETIMGDTAICINPTDERYQHLKNKYAFVPLINRKVPFIFDEYVDKEFGTGCLKVTPAHDINDYNLGLKYNLEVIDVLNEDGTMSEAAQLYIGEDRFEVRKKITERLKKDGFLVKEEAIINKNGFSQRTNAVVEPRISTQWFLNMQELAAPALDVVVNGDIEIYPKERFINTYRYWMENIKDWCISRQLWWGQRIPAWYDDKGNIYIAETEEGARKSAESQLLQKDIQQEAGVEKLEREALEINIRQDEDVLDTWFSSWLWPIEVFDGISNPGNKDFEYYYPTTTLVTGQDIIFFWVARMIMAGFEFEDKKPFSHVYFTGMVRDKQGRKMSKSLGNSPDLLQLIESFGADAVRFGIMISSPAGNDLLFDEASCEQGKFFCNKMWNAMKLVKSWEGRQFEVESSKLKVEREELKENQQPTPDSRQLATDQFAIDWFQNRLQEVKIEVENMFCSFRLSEALKTIYSLIWDDFCSWYLEWVKPAYETEISSETYQQTIIFFDKVLELLHPFMPFVTEEIYHLLKAKEDGDDLIIKQIETAQNPDKEILKEGLLAQNVITAIRDLRNKNNIKPKETVELSIQTNQRELFEKIETILAKQVNASAIEYNKASAAGSLTTVVSQHKLFITPEVEKDANIQQEELQKELDYLQGFLESVNKKLSNEKFVINAPKQVVKMEERKKSDTEAKIKVIKESLKSFE